MLSFNLRSWVLRLPNRLGKRPCPPIDEEPIHLRRGTGIRDSQSQSAAALDHDAEDRGLGPCLTTLHVKSQPITLHSIDEGNPNSQRATRSATPQDLEADQSTIDSLRLPGPRLPYMNRWRCATCVLAFFTQGLNDSAVGALLPYMESHYHVSYTRISLIFVANALGFIASAPLCHTLNKHFGRAKVLSSCAMLNALAYTALIVQPPFEVVIIAFLLLGFGFATILSLDNVFVINLQGGTVLLGFMHGFYGIGGIVAPFVSTAMVSAGIRWSLFYCLLLGCSSLAVLAFFLTFRGYETEPETVRLLTGLETNQSGRENRSGILRRALKNRTTLLGGILIFAYQGAEVSISGWVISFLIDYRNGDPAHVGYVTSGFWGGITLGRFLLVTPAHKLGDKLSIALLTLITAAFQLLLWFVPNVVGNAVAVALIGFLQGPIYPCAAGVFSKLLSRQLQITSLGLISGLGSSGGALAPFFTGLLAQHLGTVVLNPVCIFLYVVMEISWLSLPKVSKRAE